MKKEQFKVIQDYDPYILESLKINDGLVNDAIYKYRFPNNYGIMLAHHKKDRQAKWTLDFVLYDDYDNDHETYIPMEKYQEGHASFDVNDDALLHDIFLEIFKFPIYIKVNKDIKDTLDKLDTYNPDQLLFLKNYINKKRKAF